jgi:hypothetical protein
VATENGLFDDKNPVKADTIIKLLDAARTNAYKAGDKGNYSQVKCETNILNASVEFHKALNYASWRWKFVYVYGFPFLFYLIGFLISIVLLYSIFLPGYFTEILGTSIVIQRLYQYLTQSLQLLGGV